MKKYIQKNKLEFNLNKFTFVTFLISTMEEVLCGLCNNQRSKYSCPRCELPYCSLDCYKSEKHIECSESFYRECVNEELTLNQADEESRVKMIEILQRYHTDVQENDSFSVNEDDSENDIYSVDSDDGDDIDLLSRLQNLDLDDADAVWNVLTQDEKNEFEALLNGNEVSSIIPQWEPWWTYQKKEKLIEDLCIKENDGDKDLQKCPLIKDVPEIKLLTSVRPSPVIMFNIINLISSYVFVMRYFHGEVKAKEASIYLLDICDNLDNNTNFPNFDMAVKSVEQKCMQSEIIQTDKTSMDIMKHDIQLVLKGPSVTNRQHYCRAALSHLHEIFTNSKSSKKTLECKDKIKNNEFSSKYPEHRMHHLRPLNRSKVKKCVKKLEFYLSYIDSNSIE